MNPELKILLWLIVGGAVSLLFSRLFRGRDKREAVREKDDVDDKKRLSELERQIAILTAEAQPINAYVQAMAIAKLTHMHTPETDELLAKVGAKKKLSEPDMERLAVALKKRQVIVDAEVDEEERIWARIFPDIVRLAQIEAERLASKEETPRDIALVSVPATTTK